MDNVTRYAAINTKTRAMTGSFLKDRDYENLLNKKNVTEVAAYLKQNSHYKDVMKDIDLGDVHRGRLETVIKANQIKNMKKLNHFFIDGYREFYKSLFMRYEIEDLKSILRGIKTHSESLENNAPNINLGLYSNVNVQALLESKNTRDFINNLKGTIYYDYLRPLLQGNNEINLFNAGMTLDTAYFDVSFKSLELLTKEDRMAVENIYGVMADLLNIQTIYRGLKFYNLPPEELFNYTIYFGKVFNRNHIKELCYAKSLEEFQKKVHSSKYNFLFDHDNNRDIFMERRILRYQYYNLKSQNKKSSMDISRVMIYTMLLEMEIRDIISVIESVRYGMPLDEGKKFLIRKL
ncbi:V-type ATP synthase subunit C [Oxobacter pfennigii]|uniref:V-type ATP synthase subunit C n=1 Tax=Oxobacter pfennigii TaxID=36849 RepID=A0A0P8WBZ9_9CLOT|nr:V-type ATPase subunit [Oxobacter pfennigii]KPU46246.1 V-type ATP synthase subunit C [Oxobacter pfennigii]